MEQRRFVSLAEAATLANTSIDTVRRKLRKGEIQKAQTNKRGLFIDLESLREAFDLPRNTGQADDSAEKAESAGAALREMIKELGERLAQMRLEAAQTDLKHRDELAGLEAKLAVADALAAQRQARSSGCMSCAVQVLCKCPASAKHCGHGSRAALQLSAHARGREFQPNQKQRSIRVAIVGSLGCALTRLGQDERAVTRSRAKKEAPAATVKRFTLH